MRCSKNIPLEIKNGGEVIMNVSRARFTDSTMKLHQFHNFGLFHKYLKGLLANHKVSDPQMVTEHKKRSIIAVFDVLVPWQSTHVALHEELRKWRVAKGIRGPKFSA